jgi:hypothetical protein
MPVVACIVAGPERRRARMAQEPVVRCSGSVCQALARGFCRCATGLSDGTSSNTDFSGAISLRSKTVSTWTSRWCFSVTTGPRKRAAAGGRLGGFLAPLEFDWLHWRCEWLGFEYFITDNQAGFDPAGQVAVRFPRIARRRACRPLSTMVERRREATGNRSTAGPLRFAMCSVGVVGTSPTRLPREPRANAHACLDQAAGQMHSPCTNQ